MAELKTKENTRSVDEYLNTIEVPGVKSACDELMN
jgi:hypothetical protein